MHNVTAVSTFTDPVQVLDDGDPVAASQTSPTVQGLANRTQYTNDTLGLAIGLTNTATAGGTTTLTAASNERQRFTGSSNQNVVLPDETTIPIGKCFQIFNSGTGTLTIKDAASTTLFTILPRPIASKQEFAIVCSTSNATVGGNWKWFYDQPGQRTATNTNDSAAAGCVGELLLINTASPLSVSAGATKYNLCDTPALPLTAGAWRISGGAHFLSTAGVGPNFSQLSTYAAVSKTSATMPSILQGGGPIGGEFLTYNEQNFYADVLQASVNDVVIPAYIIEVSGSTPLYFVVQVTQIGGPSAPTYNVSGWLQAERAR